MGDIFKIATGILLAGVIAAGGLLLLSYIAHIQNWSQLYGG